jgi:hypothetical protein
VATRRASRLACATCSRRFAALVLALAYGTASAQDADTRLKALEAQVQELKQRVEVLEGRAPVAAAQSPTPEKCPGWDRLRISMTETEVRAVLGAPARVEATPLQTRWRYPCGTAYFDADTKRFVGYER